MNIDSQSIIGQIVAKNYKAASVFKQYGIDFCCNGNRTIAEACSKKQLDISKVLAEVNTALDETIGSDMDFNLFPMDLLADYIEKTHHRYVTSKIQEITPYLRRVVEVHGDQHPELYEIETLFTDSAQELSAHLKKEENVLFPYIRELVKSLMTNSILSRPSFVTIANPIAQMHKEHDTEGERFRKIEALTHDYTPPADACNTYRVTFSLLKEFENDLHRHIHLENNILFPKAIECERILLGEKNKENLRN